MEALFLGLLNRSLMAGWLILAVVCFRLVFRRAPKWISCLLWGMVAVRLVCPFQIESPFSLLSGTEPVRSFAVVEGKRQNYIPSIDSSLQIVEDIVNPRLAASFAYEEAASIAPLQAVTFVCGVVWGSGVALLLLYAGICLIRLHILLREAVPYKDKMWICDRVASPFILGMIRPRIYLPSGLCEREADSIAAHEYAHLKRGDHWWKPLGFLLLCVYWFQPLCWAAYFLFCRDIELACDEKVVKHMDRQEKKEYSAVLLSCAGRRTLVLSCPLTFGEVGVRARVKAVLNRKEPAFWLVLASVTICLLLGVCFLTNPPRDEKQSETRWAEDVTAEAEATEMPPVTESSGDGLQEHTETETPSAQETTGSNEILLHEQPDPEKVCIRVQPSEYRELLNYYYIPTGKEQDWLVNRVKNLSMEECEYERPWEGKTETGWKIFYQDRVLTAFKGGYLYETYSDDTGIKEYLTEDPKLCDYIQVLLLEEKVFFDEIYEEALQ